MDQDYELGGFRVVTTLGHGARSTIFLVEDPQDKAMYALKQVIRKSPADQRFLDQAITEHDIACQFNHPTLRRSIKVMRIRRLLRLHSMLMLMELVEGQTLENDPPKSMSSLVKMFMRICDGLHAMHVMGWIHADIKPNNIMLTHNRDVKIIDFGQSCPTGTVKERIQGTPDYIAPEQVKRHRISPHTDVFNLGATMYWLMTGQHVPTLIPKGHGRTVLSAQGKATPPHEINPAVPPALSSLVLQCVREDWAERPANMVRVRERLRYALAQMEGKSLADMPSNPHMEASEPPPGSAGSTAPPGPAST